MGRRGPLAMSDNVRQLRGNPGRRESQKTLKLGPKAPDAPEDLPAEARAEWDRVVPELNRHGLLAGVDRLVIASYCRAWAHACDAEALLNDSGLVVMDPKGDVRKHPAWQIWRESTSLAAALAKELLATPNARLRATMPEADDGDKAEDLLD